MDSTLCDGEVSINKHHRTSLRGYSGLSLHYRAQRDRARLLITLLEHKILAALRHRAAIGSEPWVSSQSLRQLAAGKEAEWPHLHPSAGSLSPFEGMPNF